MGYDNDEHVTKRPQGVEYHYRIINEKYILGCENNIAYVQTPQTPALTERGCLPHFTAVMYSSVQNLMDWIHQWLPICTRLQNRHFDFDCLLTLQRTVPS